LALSPDSCHTSRILASRKTLVVGGQAEQDHQDDDDAAMLSWPGIRVISSSRRRAPVRMVTARMAG
jgi:hypothetical protein